VLAASEEVWESADPALGKLCSPRAEQHPDQLGWRPIPVSAERCMIIRLHIQAARLLHSAALCRLCRMIPKPGSSSCRLQRLHVESMVRTGQPAARHQPPRFCKCENMIFSRGPPAVVHSHGPCRHALHQCQPWSNMALLFGAGRHRLKL
jgi:hypothetical protein